MMFTDLYVRGRSAQRGAVTDTQWQPGSDILWLQTYVRVMVGDGMRQCKSVSIAYQQDHNKTQNK